MKGERQHRIKACLPSEQLINLVEMKLATPKRFTIAEYHRLTEIGFFAQDDRVALIRGEINQMAAQGTAHTVCCRNLLRELAFQHEGAFNYAVRRIVLPNATISLPVATLQTDNMDDRPHWELQLAAIFPTD